MSDLVARMRRHRAPLAIAFDVWAWLVSYVVFAWLRLDSDASQVPWSEVMAVAVVTAVLYVVAAVPVRLHQGRARTASLEEMVLLGTLVGGIGTTVFVANLITQWVPRSIPAGATLGTLVFAAWARATWRVLQERDERAGGDDQSLDTLVVGAGEAGRELISSMQRDPAQRYRPVALLDDDHRKRHLRIRHVSVVGTTDDLARQVALLGVKLVVIAIPSADANTINRLRLAAIEADVPVKVLPASTQLLTDTVGIRDLRDINITDVLGRKQLDTDVAAIAGYLTGRKVLVTGAGGSIGSELCRQIHRYQPAELMMLDRDESALHAVQLSIHGRALLDSDEVILCDIRDEAAVRRIFGARRPDVVFHAAALKHLPMLEQYPAEAVKTNVLGTRTVLEAADLVGVDRFVNISTDKAADPGSVLGWSKRVAERITAERARGAAGVYLSVRFGNVLGSRGSVLASFARQIAAGGPLTVTHPEVTRYFMTIEESCQLVIQAAAIGAPGEALVLDMGEPVRIVDVARQLIEQSGTPVRIEFTGLREGEKLHEDLFASDEPRDIRPRHPLVSHVPVSPLTDADVLGLPTAGTAGEVRRALEVLAGQVRVDHPADELAELDGR
ncbi:nucleoside-diphosphate sugar epimerase/dehydratase [Nocardioides hungaricus]